MPPSNTAQRQFLSVPRRCHIPSPCARHCTGCWALCSAKMRLCTAQIQGEKKNKNPAGCGVFVSEISQLFLHGTPKIPADGAGWGWMGMGGDGWCRMGMVEQEGDLCLRMVEKDVDL